MYLISDFGNKENKAKRKTAESSMIENRLSNKYSDEYNSNPKSDEMNKLRRQELQESRKRRNSVAVDPLKKRSGLNSGEKKILAPYDSKSVSLLPKWNAKQNRGKYGNYTGVDNYMPEKGHSIAIERSKPKPVPPVKQVKEPPNIIQKSVPFRRKPIEITKGVPQKIMNKPSIKTSVSNKYNPSTVKASKLGRTLATGAVIGGVVGTGAYLINKLKNKKIND